MSYGKFGMKCLFRTENSIGTTAGKVALISDTSVFFFFLSSYS